MNDLFGTFSEAGGLSSGDPYKQEKKSVGRWGGKQFSIIAPKLGKAPDAYIDKQVRSLAEGDRYTDAWILDKRLSKGSGKNISGKPFRCRIGAANSTISCGPGSSNGCLAPVLFDTDGSSAALRSNPPKRQADKLRNIYTTAPKTGGFGMPWKDMSLGEPPKYYPDVYEGGREREKELRKTAKPAGNKPFVSTGSNAGRAFTADAQLYKQRPQTSSGADGSGNDSSSSGARNTVSAGGERQRTWRPASGKKQGAAASSFNIPPYMPDPVREAKFHAKESAAVKPFRPASGAKARLSIWSPNPYATDARRPPGIDFTIT